MEKKDDGINWKLETLLAVPGTILGIALLVAMLIGAIWLIKTIWYAV